MKLKLNTSQLLHNGDSPLALADRPNEIDALYDGKKDYAKKLKTLTEEIHEAQEKMYAHNRYSLLLVFQAMDAAGKDSTIRAVMSGVNPHGFTVSAFKRPSDLELDHDFLWRTTTALPQRGRIGVFNRSYYEEVLIVRVHPKILTKYQRIPAEHIEGDTDSIWDQRHAAIKDFERHLHQNGTHVLKFFLNVSKEEQARRFLSRIDTPEKNWKFSTGDVEERGHWDAYQEAYQSAINATSTPESPWCIIPADDKKNMRLMVSKIIRDKITSLDTHYPEVDDEARAEMLALREQLAKEV